jgi:hypothetical protein
VAESESMNSSEEVSQSIDGDTCGVAESESMNSSEEVSQSIDNDTCGEAESESMNSSEEVSQSIDDDTCGVSASESMNSSEEVSQSIDDDICGVAATENTENENLEEEMKLLIRGKNIADRNYVNFNYEYRYAELPLVAVLEELGAETNWTGENTVNIYINDKTYILNTEKCTLTEENSAFNLFQVAPGAMHGVISKVVNKEFVIDSDSARLFINVILKLKMFIDIDNKIVTISDI